MAAERNKSVIREQNSTFDEKYNNSYGIKCVTTNVLKSHQARLIACNGDCGSQIAKLIDSCVHPRMDSFLTQVTEDTQNKIISNSFWLYGYPLRKELIDLMGKSQCYQENDFYKNIYESLTYQSCCIHGNKWREKLIGLFGMLQEKHIDILNNLANKSCLQSDVSISQEVEQYYQRKRDEIWQQVAVKNVLLAGLAMSLNDNQNCDEIMKAIDEHGHERKILMDNLCELDEKKSIVNEVEYLSKIEQIKKHPNYIEMENKNLPLTNQEILAVILYCDYDIFATEMRVSQRKEHLNSCQWKKLFHYLCCALYKIYLILHNENKIFRSKYIKRRTNNLLFRGIYNINHVENEHELHTLSSFTSEFGIARDFASPNGMILTINNAYQAMYDGRLIAANVSWISKFCKESEFILLPTTLNNIRFINRLQIKSDNQYFSFVYNTDKINIYEAMDYKSVDLKPVIWSVSQRIKPPTMWMGKKSPQWIQRQKDSFCAWVILFGGLLTWQCPICGVKSRLCEYSGSILDMSVECPSCRSLFLQFGNANPDEFDCYNLNCGKIKHKDLEKVNDKGDEWQKSYSMGYRCRKCNARQRQAQFDRYTNDEFMEKAACRYIDVVEKELKYEINIKKDKEKVKEMILFVMNPKNNKAYIDELLLKFPVIWNWVLQVPAVKDAIENRKDDIMKMVAKLLGLPKWITPVITGKVNDDINHTIKSVKKEAKRGLKKLKKIRF